MRRRWPWLDRTIRKIGFFGKLPWLAFTNTVAAVRAARQVAKDRLRFSENHEGLTCLPSGQLVRVVLRQAWCWTCDVCGRDNAGTVVFQHPSHEQALTIAIAEGATVDDVKSVEIGLLPGVVVCRCCRAAFEVDGNESFVIFGRAEES